MFFSCLGPVEQTLEMTWKMMQWPDPERKTIIISGNEANNSNWALAKYTCLRPYASNNCLVVFYFDIFESVHVHIVIPSKRQKNVLFRWHPFPGFFRWRIWTWMWSVSMHVSVLAKKASDGNLPWAFCKKSSEKNWVQLRSATWPVRYVQDMMFSFHRPVIWWFFPVRFHVFCGFFPCIEKKAGWCIVSELRLQWCDYCLWPFCTMAMCCAAAGWHGRGRLVVGSWTWRRDTIATGSREFHDVRCCLSQDGWTFISLKDDDADDDDHLWNILKQPISTSSCHFTWNPRKSFRKTFFEANKVFNQQIAAENVFRCFHVFRLFSHFDPLLLFFPESWKWKMGPSKIGVFSIKLVFHFHDYQWSEKG